VIYRPAAAAARSSARGRGGRGAETDINALLGRFNIAHDGTLVIPSEYLEVVIAKSN
jgi:hypothetical protein